MPAKAGIHVLATQKAVDGRDIGERSDAVLRTAMPGHDDSQTLFAVHSAAMRTARSIGAISIAWPACASTMWLGGTGIQLSRSLPSGSDTSSRFPSAER